MTLLLFAVMALRLGFINGEQLQAALHAWVDRKSVSMEALFIRLGFLSQLEVEQLQPLVEAYVARQGGDVEKGLNELSSQDELNNLEIGDPDLETSLRHLKMAPKPKSSGSSPSKQQYDETRSMINETGRFQVIRFHDKGGLGKVSIAIDSELGREVAFKEIQDQYADSEAFRDRFLLEAEVTGRLEHPGIVPVYGLGSYPDGRPFYVMKFIRGDSLKLASRRYHDDEFESPAQKRREFRRIIERFLDVCQAIDYAHSRGVLHRDLKPGNIMLGKHGETLVVDWGLAKTGKKTEQYEGSDEQTIQPKFGSSAASTYGNEIGSLAFMSPEQASGDLDAFSPRTDVFGLGATLYYILTGKAPYEGIETRTEAKEAAKQGRYISS